MSILVTGGAGYIGVELVKQLQEIGSEVVIVDPCFFGTRALETLPNNYRLIKGDVRNPKPGWFEGVDYVVHLGGFSNDPMAEFNPQANMEINHIGTVRTAEVAKAQGVKKFSFASSASVYDHGITTDLDKVYTEDSEIELNPHYYYSVAKINAEQDLEKMSSKNFAVYCLRQGTVYGWSEKMRFDLVVNTMLKTAMEQRKINVFSGGVMWRPLVDVTDVARAHIACLNSHKPTEDDHFNVFNLLHDNYRILDLGHFIEHELKEQGLEARVEVHYDDKPQRSYKMSGKRLTEKTGFVPHVDVRSSLKTMVENIKSKKIDTSDMRYYNIRWLQHLVEVRSIIENLDKIL